MSLRDRIRKLRRERGVGLRELGESVKRSPSYLSRFERGTGTITVEELSKIANFFNIKMEELLVDKVLMPRDQESLAEVGIAAIIEHLEGKYPVIVTEIKLVRTIEGDNLAHVHINYEEKEA